MVRNNSLLNGKHQFSLQSLLCHAFKVCMKLEQQKKVFIVTDCSKHRDFCARGCCEHFTQTDTGALQQSNEGSAISLSLQIRKLRHEQIGDFLKMM